MCLCYLPQSWGWRSQLILSTEAPTGWPGKRAPPPLNAPYLASPHLPLVRRGRAGAKAQRGTTVRPRSGAEQSGSWGPILSTDSRPHPSPSEQLDYEGFLDTVGAAMGTPQPGPSPGPTATRAPGQPHAGASKGGRAPQRARPVFGGLLRAGEALSYAVGLFHTQGGNPKRRHTEAKGGEFWRLPEKPHQAPPPWAQSESPGTALAWGLDALTGPVHPSTSGISGTRHPYPPPGGCRPPQLPPQASGQAGHPISPEPTTGPRSTEGSPEVHRDRRTRRMLPGTREHLVSLGFVSMALLSFLPWR